MSRGSTGKALRRDIKAAQKEIDNALYGPKPERKRPLPGGSGAGATAQKRKAARQKEHVRRRGGKRNSLR